MLESTKDLKTKCKLLTQQPTSEEFATRGKVKQRLAKTTVEDIKEKII